MILPFAVTQALAIAIAIKMRRPCDDTWLNDHFNWQITTFWYLLGLSILAGAALLVGTLSFSAGVLFRSDGQLALSFKSLSGFAIICAAVATPSAMTRFPIWLKRQTYESSSVLFSASRNNPISPVSRAST